MEFKNIEELREMLHIIEDLWGNYWTIYSPIKTDEKNLTICFTADSYFDPILTLLSLKAYGVINSKFEWAGDEIDKVIISGCNLDIMNKIKSLKINHTNIESILNNLVGEKPKTEKPKNILLGDRIIPIEDWDKYWALEGKDGPSSGWEIPTVEQLYNKINKLK